MKEKNEGMHFPKVTPDNYFMTQEERDAEMLEKIQIIEINKISNFPNHPFHVKDDDEMQDLSDNIKEYGLIFPLLVRPKEDGTYELISGHRRKRACELAGIRKVKAIVREMTDEEATIQMVDSNKQREKVLPSEKAFAYKMRLEAMKRQAGRPKKEDIENSAPVEQNFSNNKTTREMIADEVGESSSNIQRYIRLTELIPDILKLVDEEQMKLRPAVEISYLKKEEQEYLLESIEYTEVFPSHPQARELKRLSQENKLTEDEIDRIMSVEKPNQKEHIKIASEDLEKYYPKNVVSVEQKREYVIHCVKETSERERRQKQFVR